MPADLLERCIAARNVGADFPTVWQAQTDYARRAIFESHIGIFACVKCGRARSYRVNHDRYAAYTASNAASGLWSATRLRKNYKCLTMSLSR
jgi:hypothetical protein